MDKTTLTFLPSPPKPKQTGGKRGPSHSSDEEEISDSPRSPRTLQSPRQTQLLNVTTLIPPTLPPTNSQTLLNQTSNNSTSPLPATSPPLPTSPTSYAYEHDHDYENVASPGSSTASGPIYVRPPGFKHHAQSIEAKPRHKKKKTATLLSLRDGFKRREQTPPKYKTRKDPLPMRSRALPQSFWQQPNVPHQVSPGSMFPVLPPLMNNGTEEDITDMRPVTPPEDRPPDTEENKEQKRPQRVPERKVTVANTDLLFRLFDGIGEDARVTKRPHGALKRGKSVPKKIIPKSTMKGLLSGNDPYLVETMADKLFPNLSLEGRGASLGNTSLQLITVRGDGDKTVTLPALSSDQNYSQMLSELVMHI